MVDGLLPLLLDVRRATAENKAALVERQQDRLADVVSFARANSPYFHELYRHLPDTVADATSPAAN